MGENLHFNVFNILILIGIFQGFVFCFIVFFNKKYAYRANYFLALHALALSLTNLQYWLVDVHIVSKLPVAIPFELLIGPPFFVFVSCYLKNKHARWIYVIHLIPFVVSLLVRLIVKLEILDIPIELGNSILRVDQYISFAICGLMITYNWRQLIIYEKSNLNIDRSIVISKTKWIKQALVMGILICLSWLVLIKTTFLKNLENSGSKYYPLWIMMSILVYWIVYKGIVETNILNERHKLRLDLQKIKAPQVGGVKKNDLFLKIKNTIIEEKLYLIPDLNREMIAEKFDISTGYLSKLINNNSGVSFTDFVNNLRVEMAKEILSNSIYKEYTIEAIGYESGFNSKSSFYSAFKKVTGKTPTSYKL